jgi:hypothetical protein
MRAVDCQRARALLFQPLGKRQVLCSDFRCLLPIFTNSQPIKPPIRDMRGHRAMEGSQGSGRVDNAVTGLMGLLALVLAFGACGWQGALARCAAPTGIPENPVEIRPTLKDAGIDKNLAERARKLQRKTDDEFEKTIAKGRDEIERVIDGDTARDGRHSAGTANRLTVSETGSYGQKYSRRSWD